MGPELNILITASDYASAQLRNLNTEIHNNQLEWRQNFRAIAIEAQRLGAVMAGLGAAILAPLGLSIKTYLDSITDAIKKSEEEIEVWYSEGKMIKKTINNSGYSQADVDYYRGVIQQFNTLKESIMELAFAVGSTLLPILNQIIGVIAPVIQSVMIWINQNPELAKQLLIVAATLGIVLTAMGAVLAVIGTMSFAFAGMTGPIGWAILAIMGLSVALSLLIMNWDSVVQGMKTATEAVANYIAGAVESFLNGIIAMLNIIPNVINTVSSAFGNSSFMPTIAPVGLPRLGNGYSGANNGSATNITLNIEGSVVTQNELIDDVRAGMLYGKSRNYNAGLG